jgi:hypothetical protein
VPLVAHHHATRPEGRRDFQEALNGKNVDWLEKISDEQYRE